MCSNLTQSESWYVVIQWKTGFQGSVGEWEMQNKWRRTLHLIADYFDNSNPCETVQLNKSTFETFARNQLRRNRWYSEHSWSIKQPSKKKPLPWSVLYQNKARKDRFSLSEHACDYKAHNHVMKNTCKSRQKLKRNANRVEHQRFPK